tara:strand:+ start:342 stop:860 length:519 start_codon:yes stop_codon:yes gene_type:complete
MACSNLTAGVLDLCNDSTGGIQKIYIANGPVESITESAGVITAITVNGAALVPADFFEFETPRQQSVLNETTTVSQENGTLFFDQQLTMVFNKMEATKRDQLLLMAQATTMVVVALDGNGKYWSVGVEKGAFTVSASATSGTAYGDRNGYEIVLGGLESSPIFEVTSTIVVA